MAEQKKQDIQEEKDGEKVKLKLQRIENERAEIRRIHEETGAYIGNKINGQYETSSLEKMTSQRILNNYFIDFSES